jgi:two-component system response regulator
MNGQNDILLIDDDEADVELTLHALRENKLANQIRVLRDGEEALEYLFGSGKDGCRLSGRTPKLILLDLKLPKVDGIEVLRQIKNDPGTKFIPVVILTSSKEERDRIRGYDLGVNSYIQKPVDFDQFRKIVGQVGLYWLAINQPPIQLETAAA